MIIVTQTLSPKSETADKAIFLDKDGTLIPDIPYNADPSLITLCAGVGEGLRTLQLQGFKLIIISNQAGIAHGYFAPGALNDVYNKLSLVLSGFGVVLDGFYCCPHHPNGKIEAYRKLCNCRKPLPGMLIYAAQYHHINLASSYMVGDILHDVEAGNSAGCRSILINNGNETEWQLSASRTPSYIVNDFSEATAVIAKENSFKYPGNA